MTRRKRRTPRVADEIRQLPWRNIENPYTPIEILDAGQIVNPGAPVMYGSFASNVDMRSGAPALGTPEYAKAAHASGQIARHLRPIEVNDDELALDAIAEVEPGGHHFGTSHTLARYEIAFYTPMLANRQNFESWQESGSIDISVRANALLKQMLRDYERPDLEPAIDDALVEYVEKRKQAIAAAAT